MNIEIIFEKVDIIIPENREYFRDDSKYRKFSKEFYSRLFKASLGL